MTAPSRDRILSKARGDATAPGAFEWIAASIPCQAACPAGTDIPGYLEAIARGDDAEAYRINLEDNVFPAVLGRVCTRPCEPACRHGWEGLGEPVAICFSKRSAADFQGRDPVVLPPLHPPSGKRVAVAGAGAAGLAAARDLARFGHTVTVYEKAAEPGGLMRWGIPAFRLPPETVAREIDQIRRQGVEIRCGEGVGEDVPLDDLRLRHDAVVLATGTARTVMPGIPGTDALGVRHGLDFLNDLAARGTAEVGRHVVVVGGGFTAVDCARAARMLGAESVRVVYRRTEAEMYISRHELDAFHREGIRFEPLTVPVGVDVDAGRSAGLRVARGELTAPEADGRRGVRTIPGSETRIDADTILFGTGQALDLSWAEAAGLAEDGAWRRRDAYRLAEPGLYLAGDCATGALSLIDAIAHGRRCARAVDTDLMGRERLRDVVEIRDAESTGRTADLNALPRQPMPEIPVEERRAGTEVETGYADEAARTEASRCYLCNHKYEIDNDLCIYCDRCLQVKPVEGCIVKVKELVRDPGGRITGVVPSTGRADYNLLWIDQAQCIRCDACREVCPVECISLQRVDRRVRLT